MPLPWMKDNAEMEFLQPLQPQCKLALWFLEDSQPGERSIVCLELELSANILRSSPNASP